MNDRIIISPTIWLPVLLGLLLFMAAFTHGFGEGIRDEIFPPDPVRTVADDCYSDLVVKQQTGQIGRYGIVWGLGENAPLTRGVLKAICEGAWSIEGSQLSPAPYSCGGHQLQHPGGEPYPDPDCATPTPTWPPCPSTIPEGLACSTPTIDASPTVQTPTFGPGTPYACDRGVCWTPQPTPTPTAAAMPDTGGMP